MWGIRSPHFDGIRADQVSGGSVMWVSTSMMPVRTGAAMSVMVYSVDP